MSVAVVLFAFGAVVFGSAGQAGVESCTYDPDAKAVTASITDGSSATLRVVSGDLWFGLVPAPCGGATTTNTDSISIVGAMGSTERLVLDLSGGVIGPGFTSEGNIPEIEISTALGDFADTIVVIGTAADDTFAPGQNGIALNTDGDLDVTLSPNPLHLEFHVGEGNDLVNGRGQGGAGLHFLGPLVIDGGPGNDSIGGSTDPDELTGGPGDDFIRGVDGDDRILGGPGADTLTGSAGADVLDGGTGADIFLGGYGDDVMYANDSEIDSSFNGGPGADTLHFDEGLDPSPSATETLVPYSPPPPPPPPPGTCTYDATSRVVSASIAAGGAATLEVISGEIWFGDTPSVCTGATTTTTDTIAIVGPGGSVERLTIDQGGGAFAPGATAESGASEIEISVSLGDVTDEVVVLGTIGADTIAVGQNGIALNDDTDVDVTFSVAPVTIEVRGSGGVNSLTAGGGSGAGSAFAGAVVFVAGDAGDALTGSDGNDVLVGGLGDDIVTGGLGNDVLGGGAGADTLRGGQGDDDMTGGPGVDSFSASSGDDILRADDDEADSSINGGPGTDTAYYDAGIDPGPSAVENKVPA